MKKYLLITVMIVAAASMVACFGKKKGAIDYNNKIVDLQSQIVRSMLELANTFDAGSGADMDTKHTALISSIDAALADAKGMKPFDGTTDFKDTTVALFEFYKDISAKEYKEIIDILKKGDQITEADAKRIDEINADISKREAELDDNFMVVQEAFAKKYGIPLIDNELQGEIDNL